jgi:hypothetical protein
MPTYDGQNLTLDLTVTVFGVKILVQGTVEILAIRRRVQS